MDRAQPSLPWLERANRLAVMSRLLSSTIHDVNNALQVISGVAELLQMSPEASEAVRRRGQTLEAQAGRASAVLAELSAFARDARNASERIDVRAVAAHALAMRRYSFAKANIASEVVGPDAFVDANPRHLLQVVLNLVLNAEQGVAGVAGPRIALTVAPERDRVTLTVDDNGRGVSDSGTLFDAQMDAPDAVETLGIGLSVSRALAAGMAGTITHAVRPGGGTCLTLSLPASRR